MANTIRDKLDERNFLLDPLAIISEYIPFGRNNIYEFNRTLDSMKRVRSALLTSYIDTQPQDTSFEIQAEKTRIEVKDFTETGMVEFEAEIFYPEAENVKQIEKFGVHIDAEGFVTYGAKVKRLLDSEPGKNVRVSIDKFSRILSDITFDSSRLMGTLLTHHQRQLLNLVFFDQAIQRDKYVCLLARDIDPHWPAVNYIDSGPYENEIKQILEWIDSSLDLPNDGILLVGGHGLILVDKNYEQYEILVTEYCFLRSVQIFLTNFFSRIYSIDDDLREIRNILQKQISRDPRSIAQVQANISRASYQCVLLEEIRNYIKNSLSRNYESWMILQQQFSTAQKDLSKILNLSEFFQATFARIQDTTNIIQGINNEIQGLRDQISVVSEKRLQSIFTQIKASTNVQLKTQKAAERQDSKMQVLQIILSGTFIISLIQLVVGEFSYVSSGIPYGLSPIGYLLVNIGIWVVFSLIMFWVVKFLSRRAEAHVFARITFEEPINVTKLLEWLDEFEIVSSDIEDHEGRTIRTVNFSIIDASRHGRWHGNNIEVSLSYDLENGFLYSADLDVNQPTEPEQFFKETLHKVFHERGIFIGHHEGENR